MIGVASKAESLEVADQLVAALDELAGESGASKLAYPTRLLRRIAQQALSDPSLLDDEAGRRDFAEALREAFPATGGKNAWNDEYPEWRDRIRSLINRT